MRLALTLAACLAASGGMAAEVEISASPLAQFRGVEIGERVDGLVWRGGIELTSPNPDFGGLSDLAFTGFDGELVMVSDRGYFVSARLIWDEGGSPMALVGAEMTEIQNSRGRDLPSAFSRDAEAAAVILRDGAHAALRIGFENLTRVADYDLVNGRPVGAAREVTIPDWLSGTRTNESLEALCIATPASPVAGSTLLITENVEADDGASAGFMLGRNDRGAFSVTRTQGMSPTGCVFGPEGELYILERGIALFSFRMQVRRVEADDIAPGATLGGEVILNASGRDIDNMEGLTVSTGAQGETVLTILSDNNFNDWERTLLLQFSVPR